MRFKHIFIFAFLIISSNLALASVDPISKRPRAKRMIAQNTKGVLVNQRMEWKTVKTGRNLIERKLVHTKYRVRTSKSVKKGPSAKNRRFANP